MASILWMMVSFEKFGLEEFQASAIIKTKEGSQTKNCSNLKGFPRE